MSVKASGPPYTVNWARLDEDLCSYIAEESEKTLRAYGEQPNLVDEHANHEEDTARGGYADRQLFELVQNSADALSGKQGGGRIEIRLTENYLYCADDGEPIDCDGVRALMFSRLSPKRETSEIGRFGLGFKSVLGVTDAPEFFSRSGSFRFDRGRTRERIRQVVPDAERYPVLRLADPVNPSEHSREDDVLRQLMGWATNIVRLPLKSEAHSSLSRQIRGFPPEFLLFVEHVHKLTFNDDLSDVVRILELQKIDDEYLLCDGETTPSEWKLFKRTHRLSGDARADRRSLDDAEVVPISWAAPLDRLTNPGQFWAFFPTKTPSLVAGILNAPWKTNEDRQNLLSGLYNEELIESAAQMIAEELHNLATTTDPARHLDALPRGHKSGDSEHVELLRKELFLNLHGHEIIPDQDGKLCAASKISYPPKELTPEKGMDMEPFRLWTACPNRPSNWLHHRALTRNRLATIDRLYPPRWPDQPSTAAPRADMAEWLEALIGPKPENAIEASKAAIQTAALISPDTRARFLGKIVLTVSGDLHVPDPSNLILPDESIDGEQSPSPELCVHPELAADSETREALEKLGLKPPSPESIFRLIAKSVLNNSGESERASYEKFWMQARKIERSKALEIIREQGSRRKLRVQTSLGNWHPLYSVLLPGEIVPDDGSRDDDVAVDTDFHEPDCELLHALGVRNAPSEIDDLSLEPCFPSFQREWIKAFQKQKGLPRNPRTSYLNFTSNVGVGPLEVLKALSDDGRAHYSEALLSLESTYAPWEMRHETQQDIYPTLQCESLAIYMLREHGRIRTSQGIFPLTDALGQQPKNLAVLFTLLKHPKADKIKKAFELTEPIPEFIGEEEPIPLLDVWPGLEEYLKVHQKVCDLIRCERILGIVDEECVFHASYVFLSRTGEDDERRELQCVCKALGIDLTEHQLWSVLQYETQQAMEEERSLVRTCSTDSERLLAAIGQEELRSHLPDSLLAILESDFGGTLTGIQLAEAAIATYHSDALKKYKSTLSHLGPPYKWAGSGPAVDFVCSLGFSAEWAGERNNKRPPFLELEGPYSLPPLHGYQQNIVDKVRVMLSNGRMNGTERRGMITMPTGSGKTRVAVQAIVEALRYDGFKGGILWVADRDELCEQAVESWRQVWSSIGVHGSSLRISRMWAGQPKPSPTSALHVVVATIQTLHAKLSHQPDEYEFLSNFKLVVFDEAHRSIAPTYTSVMEEIGLTRWKKEDEPFLLGLTATPYRGYNKEETRWLANRYGGNRLDAGAFRSDDPQDVIGELQNMHVLARANHKTIEGGEFVLSDDELQEMTRVPWWLPQSVEARIAEDAERTKRIIEAYENHIESNWPTLIFATSVEHAKTVAALLNARGIKSRAVSGETETSTRRRVVQEFRGGGIKALVNYGVFREGFDAPRTRAIIVARPVYSPNLYFQMIGRGLRGVKNGGNDRSLILNVQDNIQNFGRDLAFSELDWLWD